MVATATFVYWDLAGLSVAPPLPKVCARLWETESLEMALVELPGEQQELESEENWLTLPINVTCVELGDFR